MRPPVPTTWRQSIPAHTGEPRCRPWVAVFTRVYPRAYGGTTIAVLNRVSAEVYPRAYGGTLEAESLPLGQCGLSPRIRGNHGVVDLSDGQRGSIPAHTGEPRGICCWASFRRVYPRAYGGTDKKRVPVSRTKGLSPRIRGNRVNWMGYQSGIGSIPAHTGEPKSSVGYFRPCRVYPRAYGGTSCL